MINGWRLASDSAQTFIIPRMSWMATFAARSASSRDNEGFFATNALLNCARRLLRDAASRFSRIGDVSKGRYPGRLAAKSAIRAISRSANSVAERVLASLNKGVHTPRPLASIGDVEPTLELACRGNNDTVRRS